MEKPLQELYLRSKRKFQILKAASKHLFYNLIGAGVIRRSVRTYLLVSAHIAGVGERLVTIVTLVRLLSRVFAHVDLQMGVGRTYPVAVTASEHMPCNKNMRMRWLDIVYYILQCFSENTCLLVRE